MSLIYKTLFEVKLMHEYYLTTKTGEVVFNLPNQSDRLQFLLNQYADDRISINEEIEFKFLPEEEKKYAGQYLKLLTTYSGFKLAIRVNQKILSDGTLVYIPFVPLPDNFDLFIQMKKKSGNIDSLTQSSLYNPVPSTFVFSNQPLSTTKIFPFLTSTVEPVDTGKTYTQGDVASFGVNDSRQFYKNGTGDHWQFIPGNAFANDFDKLLIPLSFYYSFSTQNNVTDATFVLKNKDGNPVKTTHVIKDVAFQKVYLDFSDLKNTLSVTENSFSPDNLFTLEVSGNDGYFFSRKIMFGNEFFSSENWGIIHIKTQGPDASFNCIESDGFLVKRKLPPNSWIEAPIFEIPFKSKFLYWRFMNERGKELKIAPVLTDYLIKENKALVSKRPRSVSNAYFLLNKEGSSDTIYVPNPINSDLKKDQNDRLFMDIMVTESDLFPVIP